MCTLVSTLPGFRCCRVSARTGRYSVSILSVGEMARLIYYLSVAAHTIINLAGNANKAPTTARATTHMQGRPSCAKSPIAHVALQWMAFLVYVVALAVVGALFAFPAKLPIV